ncbi:MAG: GreA/GreB family elongation factor [Victivallales bacterium]|jgi:transcription elongation GreA/GreB family factor
MTTTQNLENLFLEAAESDKKDVIASLFSALSAAGDICSGDIPDHIKLLLEHWGDSIENSHEKSVFCYQLCEIAPPDSPVLRNALNKALRKTVPDGISKNISAAALGIKDTSVSIREIYDRFCKLRILKSGIFFFSEKENKWGSIVSFDAFTGEITVRDIGGKKNYPVTLSKVLSEFLLFEDKPELMKLIGPAVKTEKTSFAQWTLSLKKLALAPIAETKTDKIAFASLVPSFFTLDQFNGWRNPRPPESGDGKPASLKSPSAARNIKELHGILVDFRRNNVQLNTLSPEEKLKTGECFSKFKSETSVNEQMFFAESISLLLLCGMSENDVAALVENIKDKAPFWPTDVKATSQENLKVWEKLPSELIPGLLSVTCTLFSRKYLSSLLTVLPLRAINAAGDYMDESEIRETGFLTADTLMYIWKNRTKLGKGIVANVNTRNILLALSEMDTVSWQNAKKDLRKLIVENGDLQKFLLQVHSGKEEDILDSIKNIRSLHHNEIQSLLVRMSRISPDFKIFLEKNQSRGALSFKQETEASANKVPPVTSMKSYNQRIRDFEDIINKQLPENTAAISHARSYGDLRENAEYSAAKERQKFLNKRKSELEYDLASVIPINFEKIEFSEFVRIGTTVTLSYGNHKDEVYHIVGQWDSHPERNMLSCDSRFSKAVVSKRKGESAVLPDGKNARIVSIEPLPDSMIEELNNESSESSQVINMPSER